ncbi:MAG: CYTH domain-containing protein [Candidatus Micrarchaeaceae archaeon]|jgi:adenylate cyclase class 2|nr:CYTH domain-containing protein [Candidatus Micrarchaeota archaeon]HII09543.1 CYTH domain-containing protein [Candidatus Micrarchaeota archaeon]
MSKEREVEILDIEKSAVIKRLKELRAKHVGKYKFKRIEFMLEGDIGSGHSWIRVRTDGKDTTITLKEMEAEKDFGALEEYEVKTNNFVDAVKIMSKIAGSKVVYFENERDAYTLGQAYITIDKWPEIPAFLEIEAPSMKLLKAVYKRLGIKGKFFGSASIDRIYKNYGLDFRKVVEKNEPRLKKLLGKYNK